MYSLPLPASEGCWHHSACVPIALLSATVVTLCSPPAFSSNFPPPLAYSLRVRLHLNTLNLITSTRSFFPIYSDTHRFQGLGHGKYLWAGVVIIRFPATPTSQNRIWLIAQRVCIHMLLWLLSIFFFLPQFTRSSFSIWPCPSRETICTQDKKQRFGSQLPRWWTDFSAQTQLTLVLVIVWNKESLFSTD